MNGTPREDGFDITVASEVMAIFCLATRISDLKERLPRIVCAYTYDGKPVTAGEIDAAGAMTALLKDALFTYTRASYQTFSVSCQNPAWNGLSFLFS